MRFIMANTLELDVPLIVLADDKRGLIGWGIKAHSKGNYNHIMEMVDIDHFATQDTVGYRLVNKKKYFKPCYGLKFWKINNLTDKQRKLWLKTVQDELSEPWWTRSYDFLGILGQMLKIRLINNPWTKYCSERIASRIRLVLGIKVPKHPSPSELNKFFNENPEIFTVYGYYFAD